MYHMYQAEFNFERVFLDISVARSLKQFQGSGVSWQKVEEIEFPAAEEKDRDVIIRDKILTLTVPEEFRSQGRYCIKV